MARRPSTRTQAGPPWWLILVLALVIAGVGLFLWQRDKAPASVPAASTPPGEAAPAAVVPPVLPAAPEAAAAGDLSAGTEPAKPKYPLPADSVPASAAMPAADQSDAPILAALQGLASRNALAQFLNMQDFARRFVVTVDHLPRERIPAQLSAVKRVPGALAVASEGDALILQSANFARYDAFVHFAESLSPKAMVAVYLRFYPLLQAEFQSMGFPRGHFNDRVVEAIDDMLAAPEVTGPIRLVQPRVHYRFADPLLEKMSAGRKLMIRVGPANAARLKTLLHALRAELVR